MTDPWLTGSVGESTSTSNGKTTDNSGSISKATEFEDNFAETELNKTTSEQQNQRNNCNEHKPLPDSATYLQGLERKLEKLKKGSKLVDALAEKRQDCLRALLNEEIHGTQNNNDLDTPVNSSESAVHEIYRHLQPVQAVTVGETVHIVKYDQLEEQQETSESAEEDADTPDK